MHLIGKGYLSSDRASKVSKLWKGSWIQKNITSNNWEVYTSIPPDKWDFWSPEETSTCAITKLDLKTQIITDIDEVRSLVNLFCEQHLVTAWDTETTDLDWQRAELVGIGICWGLDSEQSAYIPVGHWNYQNIDLNKVIKIIKPYLEDLSEEKVFHNFKYDAHIFLNYGVQVRGVSFDTIIADYLIRSDNYHALDICLQRYLNTEVKKFDDVIKEAKSYLKTAYKTKDRPHLNKVNISHSLVGNVAQYCGVDVWSTLYLMEKYTIKLRETPKIESLFYLIEMPLIDLLIGMERKGLCVNNSWYERIANHLHKANQCLLNLGKRLYGINIQSPIQIQTLLRVFFHLKTVTVDGNLLEDFSTDASTLNMITEQYSRNKELIKFIRIVLGNRKILKMYGTYVKGVITKLSETTGRVHSSYNQVKTATGRLSSSNPNSQNFPSRGKYIMFRSGIIPEENYKFIGADYSGCELRILAHFSGCLEFIEAFCNGKYGGDVHSAVATLLFDLDRPPTKEERYAAKTINFGNIYGMQEHKLSKMLHCSFDHASQLMSKFWSTLPEIKVFMDNCYKNAICLGYTETLMGRRRYFDFESEKLIQHKGKNPSEIVLDLSRLSSNDSEALRQCANHVIQGSNADLTKKAMLDWHKVLDPDHGYISMSIHDEIISSVLTEWIDYYLPIKKKIMENVYKLKVPLVVDVHVADNWRDLK